MHQKKQQKQKKKQSRRAKELTLKERSAYAIAANLAQSRVEHILEGDESPNSLNKLYDKITGHLREEIQRYYGKDENNKDERALIMESALDLLNRLRNYYSHILYDDPGDVSFMLKGSEEGQNKKQDEENGDRPLISWLTWLYREAWKKQDLEEKFPLWDSVDDNISRLSHYGAAFFINLFLTRSKAEHFLQRLGKFEGKNKKRSRHVFSAYCQRDRISDTFIQDPPEHMLYREIMGALKIPPFHSKAGQENKKKVEDSKYEQPPEYSDTDVLPFRSQSRARDYVLQLIDMLGLLPNIRFRGIVETKEIDKEGGIIWQPAHEIIKSKVKKKSQDEKGDKKSYDRDKRVIRKTYNRNNEALKEALKEVGQRFVYDHSDGNILFEIEQKGKDPVRGVVRWRDFLTWVYLIAFEKKPSNKIDEEIYGYLSGYKETLSEGKTPKEVYKKSLPRQYCNHIEGGEDDLHTRIKTRLKFRKERWDQLNKAFEPNRRWRDGGFKKPVPKDLLPKHIQVHEILHYLIALLPMKDRESLSRDRFQNLYSLLMNYNNEDRRNEFHERVKNYFSADFLKKDDLKFLKPADGLIKLTDRFLKAQKVMIDRHLEKVKTANQTELKQIAVYWKVGLQQDSDDDPPKSGWRASARLARLYTVLPRGFFQGLFKMKAEGNVFHEPGKKEMRGTNVAEMIRDKSVEGLNPEHYDYELRADEEHSKKERRHLIRALNDWHTEDGICYLLACKLAAKKDIPTEANTKVKIGNHYIVFAHPHHIRRQWAKFDKKGLENILRRHYPNQRNIDAQDCVSLFDRYHRRFTELAVHFFELEAWCKRKKPTIYQWTREDNIYYVTFSGLVSALVDKGILDKGEGDLISKLRNTALHDQIPSDDALYAQDGAAVSEEDLGRIQVKVIEKMKKNHDKT